MGESQRREGGRRGALVFAVSRRQREHAFRKARRHTWTVRGLKLLLPVIGLGALALMGGSVLLKSRLKGGDISVAAVRVDPTNLTMEDPRYSGFAKDGSEYRVHAKSAITDLKMTGPIRLNTIDGEITDTAGAVTRLKAKWGTYDQKKDLLELYEQIDVDGANGLTARLTRATVLTKESKILSGEPIEARNETGQIRANSMAIDSKAKTAAFAGAVEVTMRPAAPTKPEAAATPAAPKRDAAKAFGLDAGSGVPVIVHSARLDVDDTARTALFREQVVATQGEAQLQAPELDVHYEGKSALGERKPPADRAQGEPAQQTKLKAMKARGGVKMTSKGDTADGQTLDYDAAEERILLKGSVVMTQQPDRRVVAESVLLDQKADTALLTEDVTVTQGRNVMKGGRLFIDRKAGTARLTTPAVESRAAGRIATTLYQNQSSKPAAAKPKAQVEESAEQAFGPLGAGFKTDPNAPIDVDAVTLDVNDRKHIAVYTGSVVAKQGTFVVKTEELTAQFTGELGLTATAGGAPKEPGKSGTGGPELKRIEARRNVVVTGADGQQATGEWATFDVKANTIVMGGNVTVARGRQIVRGNETKRLVIDLTSGISRFEDEPGVAAKGGPAVSGALATSATPAGGSTTTIPGCPPGAICKSGRLEAIFYPNQLKDAAKQKVEQTPGASEKVKEATDVAKGAVDRLKTRVKPKINEASSWTTEPKP